ncbi:serine hydrolase [Saccharophagus degradans]|uniref:Serine hydrolase domain-containing protein n=1 Tax=Saccharophagus degradans TaxID=86304 RepID=A0AAW7X062_9GAMM|nr:serine hydrolase domain-containing protein [Saccharophagus degradans]MDO6420872.1 serine hydrolase domain-containing protein [Saccharophagus degradans]MDO6609721.1 serine hydrolase domain-containing protein [Saccharophagus degradans]
MGSIPPIEESIKIILSKAEYVNCSGVVLVAVDGEVVSNVGVGKVDVDTGIPFFSKTMIDVGSIIKQFTAGAILKLEMLGKLSTQDKSSQYVRIFSADVRYYLSSNIYYFIAGDRSDGDIFEMSEDIHRVFMNSKK